MVYAYPTEGIRDVPFSANSPPLQPYGRIHVRGYYTSLPFKDAPSSRERRPLALGDPLLLKEGKPIKRVIALAWRLRVNRQPAFRFHEQMQAILRRLAIALIARMGISIPPVQLIQTPGRPHMRSE